MDLLRVALRFKDSFLGSRYYDDLGGRKAGDWPADSRVWRMLLERRGSFILGRLGALHRREDMRAEESRDKGH